MALPFQPVDVKDILSIPAVKRAYPVHRVEKPPAFVNKEPNPLSAPLEDIHKLTGTNFYPPFSPSDHFYIFKYFLRGQSGEKRA
jgi:hypothetical protein